MSYPHVRLICKALHGPRPPYEGGVLDLRKVSYPRVRLICKALYGARPPYEGVVAVVLSIFNLTGIY